MAEKRDYYEVLGVGRSATGKEIADAYRKLAIRYHPDKNPGDDEVIVRFKEAAEAFEVLNDAKRRERYDRYGHAGVDGPGGGSPHFQDVNDIFAAFGDIFGEGVFGDLFGGRGRARPRVATCDATSRSTWSRPLAVSPVPFNSSATSGATSARARAPSPAPNVKSAATAAAVDKSFSPLGSSAFKRLALPVMVPARRSNTPAAVAMAPATCCAKCGARCRFRPASTIACECACRARESPAPTAVRAATATSA